MPKTKLAVLLASFAAAQPASATTTGGFLNVRAEVRPSAVLRVEARAAEIRISEADVARGYVDVPAAGVVHVEAGGVIPVAVLDFDPSSGPFRSVSIAGSPGPLTYRLGIAAGVQPGHYALPLGLTINF
jgi:hypothetical protein